MNTTTKRLVKLALFSVSAFVPLFIVTTNFASSRTRAMRESAVVKCIPMMRSQEFRAIEPHLGFAATGLISFFQEVENPIKDRRYKCAIEVTKDGKPVLEEWTNGVGISDDVNKIQGWVSITARPVDTTTPAPEVDMLLAFGVNGAVTKAKTVRLRVAIESQESLTRDVRYDGAAVVIWKCRCRSTEPPPDQNMKPSEYIVTVKIVCSAEDDDKVD